MDAAAVILEIQDLEREGLIDEKLRMYYGLKENSGQWFFVELIQTFLADVRVDLRDITRTLNQPAVDYDYLYELYIKLKGCVACMGARKMIRSCSALHQAVEIKSKDGCFSSLGSLSSDFSELSPKLDQLMQREMRILSQQG